MTSRPYGPILISTACFITGVLWFALPRSPVLRLEDLAECFAARQERGTLAYQVETNTLTTDVYSLPTNEAVLAPTFLWHPLYADTLVLARDMAKYLGADPSVYWLDATLPVPADGALIVTNQTCWYFASTNTSGGNVSYTVRAGWDLGTDLLMTTAARTPYSGIAYATNAYTHAGQPLTLAPTAPATNAPMVALFNTGRDFAAGSALPAVDPSWQSGNWWTRIGMGADAYRYACEPAARSNYVEEVTVTTNYTSTITYTKIYERDEPLNHIGPETWSHTFTAAGWTLFVPSIDPAAPLNDYAYWNVTLDGHPVTYTHLTRQSDYSATYPYTNDIIRLSAREIVTPEVAAYIWVYYNAPTNYVLTYTTNRVYTSFTPERLNQTLSTNNLDDARRVLTNLTRTVWFGALAEVTNCTSYHGGYSTNINDAVSTGLTADALATAAFDNASEDPGLTETGLANWHGIMASVDLASAFTHSTASNGTESAQGYASLDYTAAVLTGCRLPYPSETACASGYVARIRIYAVAEDAEPDTRYSSLLPFPGQVSLFVGDGTQPDHLSSETLGLTGWSLSSYAPFQYPANTLTTEYDTLFEDNARNAWRLTLLLDTTDTLTRPRFDIGNRVPSFPYDKWTGHSYRRDYADTAWMHTEQLGLHHAIHVHTFAVVVDWSWKHLNPASPYVPEPFTPAWAVTNTP